MRGGRLAFCFGVHDHQPVGNFDHVLAEATERAYRPFLERVVARPGFRLTIHVSGSLLTWLREHAGATFDLLGTLAARGQAELLTGGFWEPILAVLPDHDKHGQIERLSAYLRTEFGVRPRGLWLAERVWEPHLPRALAAAGIEYVLLDDSHFALAGLAPEALGGYYLTEEQGALLRVFPIGQRFRYLIPFADVEATLDALAAQRGRVPAVTVVDDGEKFGIWPGTHTRCYEGGWLDRFLDRLLATDWLVLATLGDVVDAMPATGRVYLPASSYREMGEWALPPTAARDLEAARHALTRLPDGERLASRLQGGFWRAFLAKYPEVADCHWKMLRLSAAIHAARQADPADARLRQAQAALWRGQANDAYWHGIFGGCYLPHLRRAVKGALLEAERLLAGACGGSALAWTQADGNGDGHEEVYIRTRSLSVTVNPGAGGSLTEIGHLERALDVADVLTRRVEAYHDRVREARGASEGAVRSIHDRPGVAGPELEGLLAYDGLRRASLTEGWFDAPAGGAPLDAVAPWAGARRLLAAEALGCRANAEDGTLRLHLAAPATEGLPLRIDKEVAVADASVAARYRLAAEAAAPLAGRWAVQWNLALTAGAAPGRYLTFPGRPSLGSTGRAGDVEAVALIDEWAGLELRLALAPAAEIAWGPVETVSLSETRFERLYQGLALLVVWPVALAGGVACELSTTLTVVAR